MRLRGFRAGATAMADLNVQLILRLVDRATAPARAAIQQLESGGSRMRAVGREQLALSRQQIAATAQHSQMLYGQAAATAVTAFGLGKMLQPAVQFEDAMARVGAVSRASGDDLAALTESARQLGRDTRFDAEEAASGMEFLALAGFQTNDIISAMPGMLDLAAAGAIDLGSAADIASNILTGFGMEAAEMGRAGDVLVNAFTSSNTDLRALGEGMKYVAPVAAATGTSIEQTAAMIGKLGDAGIQGGQAGRQLRGMLSRLAAPTGEAAKTLDRLGIHAKDADGNLRDMTDILAEMDGAMQGMGSATQQEVISTVFGLEAASAATILLGQAGSGALRDYAGSLAEVGSAGRVASAMNQTTAAKLKELQSHWEDMRIELGNKFLPVLNRLIEAVIPLIDRFSAWVEANPELVETIGLIIAAFLAFKIAIIGVQLIIQPFIAAFWMFNGVLAGGLWLIGAAMTAWAKFGRVLMVVGRAAAAVLPWILRGFGLLRVAIMAVGRAALLNPLGLALTAIAGLVYVIYDNWQGIVEWFRAKVARVAEAFDEGQRDG